LEKFLAISLNTNLNSIKAQSDAKRLNEDIERSSEKISSGSRIIRASDDAASLALSEKFKANIRSSGQALRNANDAISVLQTLEGNLSTIGDISTRMREISIQAASDTLSNTDKQIADQEFQQLKNEIGRIASISKYNNHASLSGTSEILKSQIIDRAPESFDFRIGAGTNLKENNIKFRPSQLVMSEEDFNLSNVSVATTNSARSSLEELDKVIEKVSSSRATLGGLQGQLAHAASVSEVTSENASSANSRLRDLDYASETAINVKNKLISQTNISVLSQVNIGPRALLKLLD